MPDTLIERLEKATGPDRRLDRVIAERVGWHWVERFSANRKGGWIAPNDWIGALSNGTPILDSLHGTEIHSDVPRYTASLDAAMTLVPYGVPNARPFSIVLKVSENSERWSCVINNWLWGTLRGGGRHGVPNAAIALCIAALKARAAIEAAALKARAVLLAETKEKV